MHTIIWFERVFKYQQYIFLLLQCKHRRFFQRLNRHFKLSSILLPLVTWPSSGCAFRRFRSFYLFTFLYRPENCSGAIPARANFTRVMRYASFYCDRDLFCFVIITYRRRQIELSDNYWIYILCNWMFIVYYDSYSVFINCDNRMRKCTTGPSLHTIMPPRTEMC